jgi:hypothetical protein
VYLLCPTAAHTVGSTEPPCGCGFYDPARGWLCVNCEDPVVRLSPLPVCWWATIRSAVSRIDWETSIEPELSLYPRLARARRALGL